MSNSAKPLLSVQPHDRVVLAVVDCRELDHDTTLRFQSELTTVLDAAPTMALVLDLSHVEFLPSLALGFLVKVHKSLVRAGRGCVLFGARPLVLDAMGITGLTRFLNLRGTMEEALQSI